MTGRHGAEYVGKHRKPEPQGPVTDVIRATYALFTHGNPPLHTNKETR
jgi:hypothetical protein